MADAPETPRTAKGPYTVMTPPIWKYSETTPPMVPIPSKPPLLRALESNSVDKVSRELGEHPTSATELFWDHACEPPLCAAVRLKCSTAILQLLLEHGADPEAMDKHGRVPAEAFQKLRMQELEDFHDPGVLDDSFLFDDDIAFPDMPHNTPWCSTPILHTDVWSIHDPVKLRQAVEEIFSQLDVN